jgi:hypothetical protein
MFSRLAFPNCRGLKNTVGWGRNMLVFCPFFNEGPITLQVNIRETAVSERVPRPRDMDVV